MPQRVLLLDSGRAWRGGQRQIFLLALAMREQGFEPLAIAPTGSPLAHRLRGRGVAVATLAMRGPWDLVAARRVREIVRAWRPDVLHAHDAVTHVLSLAALVRRPSIPLVVTRHSHAPLPAGWHRYTSRVTRFIAVSFAARDVLIDAGVHPDRIHVVHPGVPPALSVTPRDWRAECGWPSDTVICGVVGRMTSEAGEPVLKGIIEALPLKARRRVRLVLLGGGGAGAGRCRIGEVEAFRAGFVHDGDAAIAGLDVLWHPSSAEGLGTAALDAMSHRVPPVAFAVGPLPELILHERCGLLAAPGAPREFARAAARLVNDPAIRARLGSAASARASEFSVDRMAEGIENVYRSVLEQAAAPLS